MVYENIIKVIELGDQYGVNKYLSNGWVLLSASTAVVSYAGEGTVSSCSYIIG